MLLDCLQRRFGSYAVGMDSHKLRDMLDFGWILILGPLLGVPSILSLQCTHNRILRNLGTLLHRLLQCIPTFRYEIVQKWLYNLLHVAFADLVRVQTVFLRQPLTAS